MRDFANTIKKARRLKGWTLERAAKESGVSTRSYAGYERGERVPPLDKAHAILTALAEVQNNGREEGTRTSSLAHLPLVSVRTEAGAGEVSFHPEVASYIAYDRVQLRRDTGVAPKRLVVMRVAGSSMLPTLRPGERVLVARYEGEPIIDGAIYVLNRRYQGVMIKRAFWQEGGSLLLRGDNPEDPHPMTLRPGVADEWVIIGRVVRVEKNL